MRSHAKAPSAGSNSGQAGRLSIVALSVAVFALAIGVGIASASKEVVTTFGANSSGSLGGQFNQPRDVAVNENGVGPADAGDIYVVDDSNHRVQRFDADGNFVSAWGADVVQPGKPGDVVGTNPFEICTVAADCKAGVASGGNTTAAGNGSLDNPQGIALDQDTGLLYVSDRDNRRVDVYDGTGAFVRSFGFDVAEAGPGNTGTGFELCVAANGDVCKTGLAGSGLGQIGSTGTSGTLGIAVSPPDGNGATGRVFLADSQNRRVNTYGLDGTSPASFGSAGSTAGTFGTTQPRKIAVDSRGIVYASNSNGNGEVERYDSANANGGGVGFLAPIGVEPAGPLLVGTAATATGGLTVDPDADGAGSEEDILYVYRDPSASGAESLVQQFGPVNDPGTTVAPLATDDVHGQGAGFQAANGLGSDASSGRLFIATTVNTVGASGHRVYVLDEVAEANPVATIAPTDDVDATGATLHGSVQPGGGPTTYHFEYVDDPTFQLSGFADAVRTPTEGPLNGTAPISVERRIEGLKPSSAYHVRLVAKRVFASGASTSAGAAGDFTTPAAAPTLAPFASAKVTDTTAILFSRVTPNSQATTYFFEWGPTASYGNATPVTSAGAGSVSVGALGSLSGLAPSTTYHFRLRASNSAGEAIGPDHTFTTEATPPAGVCPNVQFRQGVAAQLPDCRAYEQVSPVQKNGYDIKPFGTGLAQINGGGPVRADGNAVAFRSAGSFADAEWGGGGSLSPLIYLARRSSTGWGTTSLLPRPIQNGFGRYEVARFSPDLESSLLASGLPLTDDPGADAINFYLRQNVSGSDPLYLASADRAGGINAVSADLGRIAFESLAIRTPDPGQHPSERKAYELAGGDLRLVGREPGSDSPFGAGSRLGGGDNPASSLRGAVSDDGRHVFFSAASSAGGSYAIYRRSDGAETDLASPSRRTPPDPTSQLKEFLLATPDGNRVIFGSRERLTDDANLSTEDLGDLYRYDFEADELINLSAGTEGQESARVLGLLDASQSADRIYFAAAGQVIPGEGEAGKPNLYLWEDDGTAEGSLHFIATLDPTPVGSEDTDMGDSRNWEISEASRTSQATPDGTHLVFQSRANLTGFDSGGVAQVYLYDATAAGGDGGLACVSCNVGGDAADHALLSPLTQGLGEELPQMVSNDGRRVLFSSPDPLLSRDTNGSYDAYLWQTDLPSADPSGGQVSLLSSGTETDDSYAHGMSPSGDDVFFRTRERLVPQDVDGEIDLYTARVGGGLQAQQDNPPASCQGEGCQGGALSPPASQEPGSRDFRGSGNETDSRTCQTLDRRAKKAGQRSRHLAQKARQASDESAGRLARKAKQARKQAAQAKKKAARCKEGSR